MTRRLLLCALSASVLLAGCETVNTTSGGAVGVNRQQSMLTLMSSEQLNQTYAKSYQETVAKADSANALDTTSATAKRIQAIASG